MALHEFTLFVELPDKRQDPRVHTESLHRAGCNEGGKICYGVLGHLIFEFRRSSKTMRDAQNHAWRQIQAAVPGVSVIELDREVD